MFCKFLLGSIPISISIEVICVCLLLFSNMSTFVLFVFILTPIYCSKFQHHSAYVEVIEWMWLTELGRLRTTTEITLTRLM